MKSQSYEHFYDAIGAINGWDFSQVRCISEGAAWDFYDTVRKACRKTDCLLDIGTGGGENALSIASSLAFLIGIDLSRSMIETAIRNQRRASVTNARFIPMDADRLEFPAGLFNLVSCRHAPFSAAEAARVLTDDGMLFTQQVRESDKSNLKKAFGRGQALDQEDGALRDRYIAELREAGFRDVHYAEYDADEYYERDEDLLFLLKHTPIIPGFGEDEQDYRILEQFINEFREARGIRTNAARLMIIARK
ncbi:class I SAM-dependent methyltransferase [Paenibacillus ihbetae]|uniref:SAM-dependent methyltransferase n=1 Tax=Paenibacillus ihbetae TaxID=1870820 RepID=A0ABX3JNT7_9BACL|nr:class I SAM-dependent methyltransferase [Paenibacillus ihbetae]OOC58526.1 SAM-dependent methyltransferase [Paenibacillus ihbetae]